jgi:hypothetical protein
MPASRSTSRVLPGLGEHLHRIAESRDREARSAAFADLAAAAENANAVEYLLGRLLTRDANSQRFALEVAALIKPPLPIALIPHFVDLIEQSRFPTRLRIGVGAQIIRSVFSDSPEVGRVIEAVRRRVSPRRALTRLRRLAALVPHAESVGRALAEMDTGSAAPCPRCGAKLGADDLARHLWEKHRLLQESGRVREPWDVIHQWIAEYGRTNRPEFLDQSCELAQALDPIDGLTRVHRLLVLGGSNDDEVHALLRAEAYEQNATLCPHCYALVPQPMQSSPAAVVVGSGRVDGGGFRVDLSDRYLYTRLEVVAPEMRLYAGPEPGRALTRRGAILLFLIPLLALAAVFAVMPRLLGLAPFVPVAAIVGAAGMIYLAITMSWRERRNASDRAVDHAWTLLVPRMLQYEVRRTDAAFLAGLAHASHGRGDAELREEPLNRASDTLRRDPISLPFLPPLIALQIIDAVRQGVDDLPLIAEQVGDCFDDELPLDHAEQLVKDLRGDPADRTRRARLRVLVLARAFAAGLEAEDLRMIGQVCPNLGSAYASEDRDGLSRLKLLWLYRPRRLWQRVGSATTVFDLARYPKLAENYLRQRPDLLLFQASGGSDEAAPILVCEEGVVYRNVVIDDPDIPIRVRARSLVRGGGYELTIDDAVFKFREDPTLLARRLKGWAAFLFDEFLPRARLLTRRRSDIGDRLLLQKATKCAECRRMFLGLTGEIGLSAMPAANEEAE